MKKISEKNLKNKKNHSIKINYFNYMKSIHNIIYKIKYINNIKELASLSFCLSAISGRRMIEIIKLGKFKKIKSKNKIEFQGQAKTLNIKKKYNIYILWYKPKFFIKLIKLLRNSNIIKKILKKINNKNKLISKNQKISNYLSNPFNKWVKNFFNDNNRTYKDSRSIYARISFEKWFKTDIKWNHYDEDIFFNKILGHKNINSQIYYKQFKLFNFSLSYKPSNIENKNNKLEILNNLDKKIYKYIIKKKKSFKIHKTTKKIIKKKPDTLITNYLLRKFGFNTRLIQRYLNFISKYIKQKKINGRFKLIKNNKDKIII